MESKARMRQTLNHKETDRVPVDFGSTAVTGMHVTCVSALREHYGLEQRPIKVCEPYQMLGLIDDDLREALGIDTVELPAPTTMFGFPNENWEEWKAPWGQDLLVSEHFKTTTDARGSILIYPEGDTKAPPSGCMPAGGHFFDSIIRQEPIDEANLKVEDNLEEFGPLSEADIAHFRREAERLKDSVRAVVGSVGGTAFGDIALVPAPFLKYPKGIRDVTEWYMSTAIRQDYIHEIFSRQCEIAIKNLETAYEILGNVLDVLFICGTDFGTQNSSFCSTETFDTLYAPYYKRINDWVHKHTSWKTFKHSCGAVAEFMPHFIEAGFDIINPVQCSAAGMDAKMLKKEFGEELVFWGGGVDTQKTLPFGNPDEVREQVLRHCEVFAPGGGFVFNAIHNVQALTPVENMVAMFEAVNAFNGR
ncbi:MAG: uroporphyrinogen decarboxylase family protein [Candidatus Sumerlaeota bacterium]